MNVQRLVQDLEKEIIRIPGIKSASSHYHEGDSSIPSIISIQGFFDWKKENKYIKGFISLINRLAKNPAYISECPKVRPVSPDGLICTEGYIERGGFFDISVEVYGKKEERKIQEIGLIGRLKQEIIRYYEEECKKNMPRKKRNK